MTVDTMVLADWAAARQAGVARAGGKAWALARLDGYGFAVPPGLVVPVDGYQQWLQHTGLAPALLAAAQLPDLERDAAMSGLHRQLVDQSIEPAFRSLLAQSLQPILRTPPWQGRPLAVRSSSPHEDSAQASFAGIHHSVLNVVGEAALWRALVAVWASLWHPAAVAYRARLGIAHHTAAMAVLVMPLVPAQASGIAFSIDPLSGRDDHLLIHANWGLGESLVGGQADGDVIKVAERPGDLQLSVLSYQIGGKALCVQAATDGGTVVVEPSLVRRQAPVLDTQQVLALATLVRLAALALAYSRPHFDCEWAWDGDRFWLLQARPVTAAARNTYPDLRNQPDIWTRGNTRDVMPHRLAPAEWGGVRPFLDLLLTSVYRLAGYPLLAGLRRGKLFNGHVYLNLSALQWEGWSGFDVAPATMNDMVGGEQPAISVPPADKALRRLRRILLWRYLRRNEALRRRGEQEVSQAVATARQTLQRLADHPVTDDATAAAQSSAHTMMLVGLDGMHYLQGGTGAQFSMLVRLIERRLPGQGHALAAALMAGGESSITARQAYELVQLARIAQTDEAARSWLAARPGLPTDQRDDWQQLPPDSAFRAAMARFLDAYGHRGVYESYLRNPSWRESPAYLLDNLPGLANTDVDGLRARQLASAAAAAATVSAALPWWQRGWLRRLVRNARRDGRNREAARSALVAYTRVSRCMLLQIGERWVGRGWLAQRDDIFWLMPVEILAVLTQRHAASGLIPLVADRQAQMQEWEQWPPLEVVLEGGDVNPGALPAALPTVAPAPAGHVLRGVPVGTGTATGRACVLHSPDEGHRLQPGDILVAPATDPGWTPLFLRAAGLVMETGGALSHGAIVAREFGVPAVVNVSRLLALVRDGDQIRVDGQAGTVTIL